MRLRALLVPPALLAALWAVAIWWPSQMAISSANDRAEDAASQQLLLVTDIDRLNETSSQLSDIAADLETIDRLIPSDPAVDIFLGTLAEAAARNSVQINLVSPTNILDATSSDSNRPIPAGMSATEIAIEAEGSYERVMTFVSALDDLPRLVVIDQIGLVAFDGDTQVIVADLSLRIFFADESSSEFEQ